MGAKNASPAPTPQNATPAPSLEEARAQLWEKVLTCSPSMRIPNGAPEERADKDPQFFQRYVDEFLAQADGMCALGQALNKDGTPPKTLQLRSYTAAALYHYARRKTGRARFPILCTGGDPVKTGTPESFHMKKLLMEKGVAEEDIFCESLSTTTMENAYYAMDILMSRNGEDGKVFGYDGESESQKGTSTDPLKMVFVTSEFHTPRALYCFEACLAENTIIAEKCSQKDGSPLPALAVEWLPLPASSGCPLEKDAIADEEMGPMKDARINEQSLRQRLMGERFFCVSQVVPNLAKHIKKGEVVVQALPEERMAATIQEVDDLIAVVKANM